MKPTAINIFLMQKKTTQKEISEHLGVSQVTVSLLLAGKLATEHRLDQIAAYLNITRARLDRLIRANGNSANGG